MFKSQVIDSGLIIINLRGINLQDPMSKSKAPYFHIIMIMWDLHSQFQQCAEFYLPPITYGRIILLILALLLVRALVQKVLAVYFQIPEVRPHHNINTLEYSYFYHLSLIILVLVEVEWNMFDLAVWAGSYIGVGFMRKAIHIIRIEKDLVLSDYSYNRKIMQILSASKFFGLILFLGSLAYFVTVTTIFS